MSRIEASDDEWKEQLEEELQDSGLLDAKGRILRQVPNGLVNLNYDIHVCVHMGTELTPEESAYPPTAISFPGIVLTIDNSTFIKNIFNHFDVKFQEMVTVPINSTPWSCWTLLTTIDFIG